MQLDKQAIIKWLGLLGWKHHELARRAGVTPETLSRWLNSQMPTVEHLLTLAKTLNKGLEEKGFSVDLTMEDLLKASND